MPFSLSPFLVRTDFQLHCTCERRPRYHIQPVICSSSDEIEPSLCKPITLLKCQSTLTAAEFRSDNHEWACAMAGLTYFHTAGRTLSQSCVLKICLVAVRPLMSRHGVHVKPAKKSHLIHILWVVTRLFPVVTQDGHMCRDRYTSHRKHISTAHDITVNLRCCVRKVDELSVGEMVEFVKGILLDRGCNRVGIQTASWPLNVALKGTTPT